VPSADPTQATPGVVKYSIPFWTKTDDTQKCSCTPFFQKTRNHESNNQHLRTKPSGRIAGHSKIFNSLGSQIGCAAMHTLEPPHVPNNGHRPCNLVREQGREASELDNFHNFHNSTDRMIESPSISC
jgi:hypothetical protein